MRVLAPAKLNLHLRVGPPAPDGFHPLLTWMVTASLFDTLDLELSQADRTRYLSEPAALVRVTCDDPAVPVDASNLVVKVAAAMLRAAEERSISGTARQAEPWSLSAVLHKRIPAGAGLGGGSSDGTATAVALNRMLGLNWEVSRLSDFLAQFGSDLSFFVHGPSNVCTGRGQVVTPTAPPRSRNAVLVLPEIQMPTPAVYRRFDEMKLGRNEALRDVPDWHTWSALSAGELLPRLINDLELPAFAINPMLADLHERAQGALGRIVRMSGSGSSLFSLFDTRHESESAAVYLRDVLGAEVRVVAVELCPNAET